jgi:phage terminase large subunit-like protein
LAAHKPDIKWIRNKSDEVAIQEGCYWDDSKAKHICDFFENFLCVTTGRLAGEPFKLLDWQRDFLSRLNGWRRTDGTRRFRRGFLGISKKNGKSQLASGLALYFGLADDEIQPEVIMAASSRDQANVMFRESKNMVKQSKSIKKICNIVDSRKRIELPSQSGYIAVISSEASTSEGLNASLVLEDEIHVWYGRELYDSLKYATIARKHGLVMAMTTAGDTRDGFCFEFWDYSLKVMRGDIIDTELLPIVYTADGMDLEDPKTWYAVNPSLGVVLSEDEFRTSLNEAKQSPINWQAFKRYRLGIFAESAKAWLDMVKWDGCTKGLDAESLKGQICFGGLDLSHKKDLTSFVMFFPESRAFLCWAWTTSYQVNLRTQKNKAPYMRFIEDGHLIKLDGEVIDQDFMYHKILEVAKIYKLQSVAYDAWSCQQLALKLEAEGIDMASFRQGYGSLSEPTKLFEESVLKQDFEHFNNPLLKWCASNVMVTQDASGNIKPDKDKSHEMIDPIVCCIMAIGLAGVSKVKGASVYEERGLLVF